MEGEKGEYVGEEEVQGEVRVGIIKEVHPVAVGRRGIRRGGGGYREGDRDKGRGDFGPVSVVVAATVSDTHADVVLRA